MAKGPSPSGGNAAALSVFRNAGSVFGNVVGSLQTVASMGGQPAAAISAVGGQLGKVASLFGPWGQAAGAFLTTASQIPQVLKSAGDSIKSYVQAFSPLTAQRYDRAWMDLQAAIGRTLLPVLNAATDAVRYFADITAGVGRVLRPFVEQGLAQLRPFFAEAGAYFKQLVANGLITFQAWKPVLDLMIQLSSGPLRVMTSYLAMMTRMFESVNKQLALLFGIKIPDFQSQGLSYVNTQTTSVSNMIDQIRLRAFQLGGDKPNDKQQQQVDLLKVMTERLANLPQALADKMKQAFIDALAAQFPPAFQQAITNMSKAATGLNNFFGGGGGGGGGGAPGGGARKPPPLNGLGGVFGQWAFGG